MTLPEMIDSKLELAGRVATLTFCRDDVRNALTGTGLVEDILTTIDWVNRTPEVSALVMTGAGKAFSSGGNVKDMRDRTGVFCGSALTIQENYRHGIQKMPLAMEQLEVPVIAAINGAAIGAGFDLACMCDIRIGSTNAVMGETFVNLGIIPGDGGAWFLQRAIGYSKAAELTFTGRLLTAEEALTIGVLLELTTPDRLTDRVHELAALIAEKPPQALRMCKRLLKQAQRVGLADFLDICSCYQGMVHHTEDHMEAVSAFLEKRTPCYTGK